MSLLSSRELIDGLFFFNINRFEKANVNGVSFSVNNVHLVIVLLLLQATRCL